MIFDIVEYIIVEWTMPNRKARCVLCVRKKPDMQDMQEGACLKKKKKKSVADQFAAVNLSIGQTLEVLLDSKTKQGRLRGRQVLFFF